MLCIIIQVYLVICVVRIVMSWLAMDGGGILQSIGSISYALTEPLFATVRRYMPQMGDIPIDFSPLIVMLCLGFLQQIICSL
jgi:uncharacterized protein YggT (Ycf19 family)